MEKTRKPFPDFYQILFDRYAINPTTAVFIDDNLKNIVGAKAVGLNAIRFQSADQLREELKAYNITV